MEKEPEKLKNTLLITDYAKVKKYGTKTVATTRNLTMTATLFRQLTEQGYKFSMITTEISSHVRYLLEEKGVRLLSLSLRARELLLVFVKFTRAYLFQIALEIM